MIYGKPPPSLEALMSRLGVDPTAAQGITAIGSIGAGSVSLDVALDRCRAAEAQLDAARAAARRAGKGTGALFAKSRYVLRDSATRWCDEARREGHLAGADWLATALENARRPDRDRPFAHAGRALAERRKQGREFGVPMRDAATAVDEVAAIQQRILADREIDLSSNRQIGAPTKHGELADTILKAGARARTPTDADPPREMNALSSAIVAAGKKRRNEE